MVPSMGIRGRISAAFWLIVSCLLLTIACSRPMTVPSGDATAESNGTQVPFHDGEPAGSENSTAPSALERALQADANPSLRDTESLPIGTLLTVRLNDSIDTDFLGASGSFRAVVDEPVSIQGKLLIPRGSVVAGRVESARASKVKRTRNYVRLTLDSLEVSGRDLPVQTSSLFAHGNTSPSPDQGGDASDVIRLERGRRLTFRLTEPVYLASRQPISSH